MAELGNAPGLWAFSTMNRRRWKTRYRITLVRRHRTIDFAKYNPQIPLPFVLSFRPERGQEDEREIRDER